MPKKWAGPDGQSCENCLHFMIRDDEPSQVCVRYPPIVLLTTENAPFYVLGAATHRNWWCGEWTQDVPRPAFPAKENK